MFSIFILFREFYDNYTELPKDLLDADESSQTEGKSRKGGKKGKRDDSSNVSPEPSVEGNEEMKDEGGTNEKPKNAEEKMEVEGGDDKAKDKDGEKKEEKSSSDVKDKPEAAEADSATGE